MISSWNQWLLFYDREINDEEQINRKMAIYNAVVSSFIHLVLLLIFCLLGEWPLAYFNIGSVLCFFLVGYCARRNHLNTSWILASSEFMAHACFACSQLGLVSNFQWYILVSSSLWFLLSIHLWFKLVLTLVSIVVMGIVLMYTPEISATTHQEPEVLQAIGYCNVIFLFSILAMISAVYSSIVHNVRDRLDQEYARSEALLHNILPESIADRLKKNEEETIADGFKECSVLFSDIVGFTPLSAQLSPHELVDILNQIFSILDDLVDEYGLEKIKTIGDAYMVASGIPEVNSQQAKNMADFALAMQQAMHDFREESGLPIHLRIGIHSGPVVAGVIGKRKFTYDLWGDTVNIASRMESHGKVDQIHLSDSMGRLLEEDYELESRGAITVKGKGEMKTWFLMGIKESS